MDINNSEEVKKFVKRTVKEHPEIEFTSDNFIEKSRELQLSPEFNDALSSATDSAIDALKIVINEALEELKKSCKCLIV